MIQQQQQQDEQRRSRKAATLSIRTVDSSDAGAAAAYSLEHMADLDLDGSELAAFDLPASPVRSPVGSESNMSVWVEETTDGEQRVHVALADASVPSLPSLSADMTGTTAGTNAGRLATSSSSRPSSPASFDASRTTSEQLLDFPLVLYASTSNALDQHSSSNRSSNVQASSSAIVPFQKLQMDTNLNQTLLPTQTQPSQQTQTQTSTSAFAWEAETSDLMHALRLGDLRPTQQAQQPQLSVRLRGSRVELASASEDDDVDFMGPAETIKKLFKLPYSQARVSLAVHRVGSTLVVDGELRDADLPAGFDDLAHESLALERSRRHDDVDDAERTQSLLYEKFVYATAVQAQLTAAGANASTDSSTGPPLLSALDAAQATTVASSKKQHKRNKKRAAAAAVGSSTATAAAAALTSDAMGSATPSSTSWMSSPAPSVAESSARTKSKRKKAAAAASASYSSPADHHRSSSDAPYTSAFQRVLKWKFHDLKMILGSQVLLFSDKDHPAVSLKLHDMDTDLSLCTVLDYYLDNVIANIPELAICMHSKGVVRGYKLVETREIPYLSGPTQPPLFDIHDVSLNASMLLKFLKDNCARPNGTYWLYRRAGESSLRLYDVDVLSQGKQLKWKYMMAMLCYRFATRAMRLVHSLARDAPTLQIQLQTRQRELLSTCTQLLREIAQAGGASHSTICASVSEQLADTYLRECEQTKRSERVGCDETDGRHAGSVDGRDSVDSRDALLRAMATSLDKAAEHLLESIASFEECMTPDRTATASSLSHEHDDSRDSATADTTATASSVARSTNASDEVVDDDDNDDTMNSFMDDERERLQLKFSSVCVQLAQVQTRCQHWDDAVAAIARACLFLPLSAVPHDVAPFAASSALRHDAIRVLLERLDFDGVGGSSNASRGGSDSGPFICVRSRELRCCVLEAIGDVAAQLPTHIAAVLEKLYRAVSGEQRELLVDIADPQRWTQWLATADAEAATADSASDAATRHEALLRLSFSAYLRALTPSVDSELYFLLMKKLGNASNELGKFFLGTRRDYAEAFRWFERGCKVFSEIEDGINVALLCANLAHLHKLLAQSEATATARQTHYEAAIALCRDALQQLRQNKAEAELHHKVKGELALTYLVWAVSMASDVLGDCRDTGSNVVSTAHKQRENDVLKTFSRALSLYHELADAKQVASTHYQMASFHRRLIARDIDAGRTMTTGSSGSTPPATTAASTSTLKSRLEIARRHYEKALAYFGRVEVAQTFVLIHNELADLYALSGRVEDVEHALLLLLNTYDAFHNAAAIGPLDSQTDKVDSATNNALRDAMAPLARDVAAKVKLLLHQLIRLSTSSNNSSLSTPTSASAPVRRKKLDVFKQMYREAIYFDERLGDNSSNGSNGIELMLATLRAIYLL